MCAITGEATSPALREDIRRCLREMGAAQPVIFNRYGSTEMGAFAQCQEEGDWHNPSPELQYHEIVDPETGRRLPDGERGTLAVTHLDKRGTALIRFVVGDVVSIDRTPCPHCGRTSERVVGPVVRTKDLIKVKGMLINPDVLLDALQSMPAIAEFQIVIQQEDATDPLSMDEMLIRVALQNKADASIAEEIAARGRKARQCHAAYRDRRDGRYLQCRGANQGGAFCRSSLKLSQYRPLGWTISPLPISLRLL